MTSKLFSIRMDPATLERLDARARDTRKSKSRLAQDYIEEGLRMEAHPGIVFRDGPFGRRAAVVYGPDVWQIMPVVWNVEGKGELAIEQAADWLELPEASIRAAIRYYVEYSEEIDEWIRRNDEIAERAEAEWLRQREILAR
jgi:Ribbon-helix-helix protein, copG family